MPNKNIIGKRVRKQREDRNLTQDQFAGACQRLGWDMSRVTVAKIETGVRGVNDGEIVIMAAVLKCPPGELIDGIKIPLAITVARQGASGG